MDVLEAIHTRRSIRHFTEEPVDHDDLHTIFTAAMAAPSAGNEQPWRFIVVQDKEMLLRLSQATQWAQPLSRAPLGLVVCADTTVLKYEGFWVIDCAAAIENALLAAHAIGLGGVWLGVYPEQQLVDAVRAIFDLPPHIIPMSMVAIGHPLEPRPAVDRFESAYVHHEQWNDAE